MRFAHRTCTVGPDSVGSALSSRRASHTPSNDIQCLVLGVGDDPDWIAHTPS